MNKRIKFDFEIDFTNGGGLQGQGFRLDITDDEISDGELATYLADDMRLLMVGDVRILNKEIIAEKHKRTQIDEHARPPVFIDLSHTIADGLITYKGLPAPIICDYLSREQSKELYAPGTQFQIGKIEMVANTGTYIDCPFHRYEDGKDLSEVHIRSFTDLEGIVIDTTKRETAAIDATFFKNKELSRRAVLVYTGWDRHWNSDRYFENHPHLTQDAAEYLQTCDVALVGIDSLNIDDTAGKARPVHSILLGSQILIVEHLCNLSQLPKDGFTFSAIPPKIKGIGSFPVRAVAKLA